MNLTKSLKSDKSPTKLSHLTKLIFALFAGSFALTSWALASPVGSTPDEDYHLVSIWCGQGEREGLCLPGSEEGAVLAPTALINSANCFAFHPELSANCALPDSNDFTSSSRSNADGGYPPLFYWTMSWFASSDIQMSVISMRLFNSGLYILLLSSVALLSPKKIRFPIIGGALITIIPLGIFLIPSVNPSSWAIISATTLWGALMGFFRSETTKIKWALFGIAIAATFIGSGARSDSAVYSCIGLVTAVILSWKYIMKAKLMLFPALSIIPISLFFYLLSGQSSIASSEPVSNGFNLQLAVSNMTELPSLWVGTLGTVGLGWLDTEMPAIVWVTCSAIFFAVVFTGLSRISTNKIAAIGVLALSITAIPLYVLVHDNISVGTGVQPRYIFPLMIMIAGVSLWGISDRTGNFTRIQILIVVIGLSIANSIALHTNIRRYVTGNDSGGFDLNQQIEWWWQNLPSPMIIWAIGTISFFGLMLILLKTVWKHLAQLEPRYQSF